MLSCISILKWLHLLCKLCPSMPDRECFNSVPPARVGRISFNHLFLEICSKTYRSIMFLIYSILDAVMILWKVVTYSLEWWVLILCVVPLLSTIFTSRFQHNTYAQ